MGTGSKSRIVVRYAETDQMGIAHHANYPVWFEVARTDLIKTIGITYTELEEMGAMLPLVALECRYFHPAKYEDVLVVEAFLTHISAAKMVIGYRVLREGEENPLCTGSTTHAIVDQELRPMNFKRFAPEIFAKMLAGVVAPQ